MTLKYAVLGLLTATALGLMIGSLWNTHTRNSVVRESRIAHVEIGPVEIVKASDK